MVARRIDRADSKQGARLPRTEGSCAPGMVWSQNRKKKLARKHLAGCLIPTRGSSKGQESSEYTSVRPVPRGAGGM